MSDSGAPQGSNSVKVRVDGEEALLHITDQSVMFEQGGRVSGFERSAIRMVKPEGDAMIIAYSVGSKVESVRVEPMTAVTTLLVPGSPQAESALAEVFEKLYRTTRVNLEARLARVQNEPENKSLRLTPDERTRYFQVWEQMAGLVGAKYHFDPWAEGNSLSFLGLEKEPYDRQLDTIKTLHIFFLIDLVGQKAETADISYSTEDVWPEDWEHILVRFKLSDRPLLSEKYYSYLKSKWKRQRGNRTPILAR